MLDSAAAAPVTVVRQDELVLARSSAFENYFVLSPYVWRAGECYDMLVRAVNPAADPKNKVARIHSARSDDRLRFAMSDAPVVTPGSGESDDDGGCEDPTVVAFPTGYNVYYSGYSRKEQKSTLLLASGPSLHDLRKKGTVLPPDGAYANAKGASLVRCADGYRLFFEYSRDEASRIGCAESGSLGGPWHYAACAIEPRNGSWDAWHLSPGPVVTTPAGRNLMFYNGATRDAHWRIGWLELDGDCRHVTARGQEPLVTPPSATGDSTDIAFVASLGEAKDAVWLYYAVGDRQLMRAIARWS